MGGVSGTALNSQGKSSAGKQTLTKPHLYGTVHAIYEQLGCRSDSSRCRRIGGVGLNWYRTQGVGVDQITKLLGVSREEAEQILLRNGIQD